MYMVEWVAELAPLSVSDLDLLHELLLEACDELGADLAWAQVLDGWNHSYAGDVRPHYYNGEQPQSLAADGVILSGLPSIPVPWCYLGPDYSRLLSAFLVRTPPQWEQRPTARGTALHLSRVPVKGKALGPAWFPAEYCVSVRRSRKGEETVTGAAVVPTWI